MAGPEGAPGPEKSEAHAPGIIDKMPDFSEGTPAPAPEPPKFEYTKEQEEAAAAAREAIRGTSEDMTIPGNAIAKNREAIPPELRRQPSVDLTQAQEKAQRDAYYGSRAEQTPAAAQPAIKRSLLDRLLGRK